MREQHPMSITIPTRYLRTMRVEGKLKTQALKHLSAALEEDLIESF
jgi:hypothetical protein